MLEDENVTLPEIKMEGRSGCKLEVLNNDGHVIIKKYSNSLGYNERLLKQAKKQQDFYNSLDKDYCFSTAKVIETSSAANELAWFSMPYLFSEKYSDYLENANLDNLNKLLENLLDYFNFNIAKSKAERIDSTLIDFKIIELTNKISDSFLIKDKSFFLSVLDHLKTSLPGNVLITGKCHGDFTFSNILFSDNKIYLLDFLDSFIESPLIDIVKLRQDTFFKWSIMLEKDMPAHKKNKLVQTFNYLDAKIAHYCNEELGMGEWYNYLQVFNLMRIVPYLYHDAEILFIEKSLRQIL